MTIPISSFVNVEIVETPEPVREPPERLPFVSYEQRFERDGRWLLGPRVLAKICRHIRGKSIVAGFDAGDSYSLILSLPEFPTIRDEVTADYVDIYYAIPEELRTLVDNCCTEVLYYRSNDLEALKEQFIFAPMRNATVVSANALLQQLENERVVRGDPRDPPLWMCLAERFGFENAYIVDVVPEPFRCGGMVK